MNRRAFSDDKLRQAAAKVRNAMVNDPSLDAMETPRCSEAFQKNMGALLQNNHRNVKVATGFKRAMAACLAVVLCMTAWLAIDVDAREAVMDWAKNLFSYGQPNYESFEYLPRDNQLPELVAYYLPSKDYKQISREYDGDKCTVTYKGDAEDALFSISYSIGPEIYSWSGSPFSFDYNTGTSEVIISKDSYALYTPQDTTQCKNLGMIRHVEGDVSLEIIIAYYFDHEIAIRIADHIMTREQAEELTLPIKYLDFVPENFVLGETHYNSTNITYRYYYHRPTNGSIARLALNYHRLGEHGEFYDEQFYPMAFTETVVQISGKDARLYTYNRGTLYTLLVWDDGEIEYELQFNEIDVETAIKIAENIQ